MAREAMTAHERPRMQKGLAPEYMLLVLLFHLSIIFIFFEQFIIIYVYITLVDFFRYFENDDELIFLFHLLAMWKDTN